MQINGDVTERVAATFREPIATFLIEESATLSEFLHLKV